MSVADYLVKDFALAGFGHEELVIAKTEMPDLMIEQAMAQCMDPTPRYIRTHPGLNKSTFARARPHGRFGREATADCGLSWERTDPVQGLKRGSALTVRFTKVYEGVMAQSFLLGGGTSGRKPGRSSSSACLDEVRVCTC